MTTDAQVTDSSVDVRDGAPDRSRPPVRALVRLSGELSTKSRRTRSRFQQRLVDNLRDAFRAHGLQAEVEPSWSRLYVEGRDEEALDVLGRVFGISSFSRIEGECEASLPAIVDLGRELFGERVKGKKYAVRARRSGTHDFSSYDVQDRLGAALNPGAQVDLDEPDVTVRVEVREDRAYLFSDRRRAAGGLPLGVQGTALALVSGGYDSAVAAWMALRRGIAVDFLFCNLGGAAYKRMTLEVVKVLTDRWSYGTRPTIHVLDFGPLVDAMREGVRPSYLQVVLKRLMYRAGCRVADEIGADALVTGESVGQVSSQTLPNLRAIDDAAWFPVLRPLVGFDKDEILERARAIGTYDLSSKVREYCALTGENPVTASDPAKARAAAAAVDDALLGRAVEEREVLDLRGLARSDVVTPNLFVSEVPEDAIVVDTRDADRYGSWHWEGAERRDLEELFEHFGDLDRDATYVLYCEEGTRTAHLAEEMQSEGYEAYSFRGGVGALRRLERSREDG